MANSLFCAAGPAHTVSRYRSGFGNWWQVLFLAAAVGGSWLASRFAAFPPPTFAQPPISTAFVAGFLLVFGSRLAFGCTSGHGISGMSLLVVESLLAVPAMFAGGILTALVVPYVFPALVWS
jgi:uncharacterized membrane protein YedE/YeeE